MSDRFLYNAILWVVFLVFFLWPLTRWVARKISPWIKHVGHIEERPLSPEVIERKLSTGAWLFRVAVVILFLVSSAVVGYGVLRFLIWVQKQAFSTPDTLYFAGPDLGFLIPVAILGFIVGMVLMFGFEMLFPRMTKEANIVEQGMPNWDPEPRKWLRLCSRLLGWYLIIIAPLLFLLWDNYLRVTAEGFYVNRFFSVRNEEFYPWRDANLFELSARVLDEDSIETRMSVSIPGGGVFELWGPSSMSFSNSQDGLDAIIDLAALNNVPAKIEGLSPEANAILESSYTGTGNRKEMIQEVFARAEQKLGGKIVSEHE